MPSRKQKNEQRKAEMAEQKSREDSRICGAVKRTNGKLCMRTPGWGTDHSGFGRCKFHSGSSRSGKIAAAHEEINGMALARAVSPTQALTAALNLTAGQLAYATEKVAELTDEQLFGEYVNRETGIPEVLTNVWLKLQRELTGDIAKFAKLAIDAGLAERDMNLREAQTQVFAALLEAVVGDLNLTAAQRKRVGPAVRRHLTVVTSGQEATA